MEKNPSTVENAKEKLDHWLKQGITPVGGKLPSERELGELLGIKRMTLRQALLNLEAESRIFRKDRKGWFVTQPRFNYSPELSASFQRAALEQGREPSWGLSIKAVYRSSHRLQPHCSARQPLKSCTALPVGERWKGIRCFIMKPILTRRWLPVLLSSLKVSHSPASGKNHITKT